MYITTADTGKKDSYAAAAGDKLTRLSYCSGHKTRTMFKSG